MKHNIAIYDKKLGRYACKGVPTTFIGCLDDHLINTDNESALLFSDTAWRVMHFNVTDTLLDIVNDMYGKFSDLYEALKGAASETYSKIPTDRFKKPITGYGDIRYMYANNNKFMNHAESPLKALPIEYDMRACYYGILKFRYVLSKKPQKPMNNSPLCEVEKVAISSVGSISVTDKEVTSTNNVFYLKAYRHELKRDMDEVERVAKLFIYEAYRDYDGYDISNFVYAILTGCLIDSYVKSTAVEMCVTAAALSTLASTVKAKELAGYAFYDAVTFSDAPEHADKVPDNIEYVKPWKKTSGTFYWKDKTIELPALSEKYLLDDSEYFDSVTYIVCPVMGWYRSNFDKLSNHGKRKLLHVDITSAYPSAYRQLAGHNVLDGADTTDLHYKLTANKRIGMLRITDIALYNRIRRLVTEQVLDIYESFLVNAFMQDYESDDVRIEYWRIDGGLISVPKDFDMSGIQDRLGFSIGVEQVLECRPVKFKENIVIPSERQGSVYSITRIPAYKVALVNGERYELVGSAIADIDSILKENNLTRLRGQGQNVLAKALCDTCTDIDDIFKHLDFDDFDDFDDLESR